ncbi:hypothetical protein ILYODFUR_034496 [Ilyodon furcidens]|uniref:Uncharacterized protein n=1 Tax=Ilyodon furcidens TaxID=33524 RepID=A0ABV0TRX5_9TELE
MSGKVFFSPFFFNLQLPGQSSTSKTLRADAVISLQHITDGTTAPVSHEKSQKQKTAVRTVNVSGSVYRDNRCGPLDCDKSEGSDVPQPDYTHQPNVSNFF